MAGDQLEHLDDAQHHVRDDRRPLNSQVVPVPTSRGEVRECLAIGSSGRIPGISALHRTVDGSCYGLGDRHVHLRHPQWQYIVLVGRPLHTRALPQLLQRQLPQWVHAASSSEVLQCVIHEAKIDRMSRVLFAFLVLSALRSGKESPSVVAIQQGICACRLRLLLWVSRSTQ